MSAPVVDQAGNIANLQTQIAAVTAQMAPNVSTEEQRLELGTYLTQLYQALEAAVGVQAKTRKPFRAVSTHPRW